MKVTDDIINKYKSENPGIELAKVNLKAKDEKTEVGSILIKVPDRQIISEAEKWENSNPGKSKEIYVRNCVLTETERVIADDVLFYQAYFAIVELLPFQKPDVMKV